MPTRRGSRSFAAKLSTLSAKVLKLSPPGKLRVESAGVRFGRQVKSLMVGDSLQVDIEPAARAGAITAYKPARFLGMEEARRPGVGQHMWSGRCWRRLRSLTRCLRLLTEVQPSGGARDMRLGVVPGLGSRDSGPSVTKRARQARPAQETNLEPETGREPATLRLGTRGFQPTSRADTMSCNGGYLQPGEPFGWQNPALVAGVRARCAV